MEHAQALHITTVTNTYWYKHSAYIYAITVSYTSDTTHRIKKEPSICQSLPGYAWYSQIDALGPAVDVLVEGLQTANNHQDALLVLKSAVEVHYRKSPGFIYALYVMINGLIFH